MSDDGLLDALEAREADAADAVEGVVRARALFEFARFCNQCAWRLGSESRREWSAQCRVRRAERGGDPT